MKKKTRVSECSVGFSWEKECTRINSDGNIKVKGGFLEINFFPSSSKSFLEVQAVIPVIKKRLNKAKKIFLITASFFSISSHLDAGG